MSRSFVVPVVSLLLFAVLSACAAVDGSIPSRVYSLNLGSEEFKNDSILLNIVRASYSQPLNFFSVTKISPSGSLNITAGVPTINEGPNQTVAQKLFTFGPNSLQTQISGSFDFSTLDSTTFYTGLLTPTGALTIDLLLHQGFERDFIMEVMLESVRIHDKTSRLDHLYRNDPTLDAIDDCPDFDYVEQANCHDGTPGACPQSPYSPAAPVTSSAKCPFHHFQFYLKQGIRFGLTTETRSTPNPDFKPGGSAPRNLSEGHFCFDPALSELRQKGMVAARSHDPGICNGLWLENKVDPKSDAKGKKAAAKPSETTQETFPFTYVLNGKSYTHVVSVEFIPRSTFAIFQYLGHLLNQQRRIPEAPPSLAIVENQLANCFAHTTYNGVSYCVPNEGSERTKTIFGLLTQLMALYTTPADLPITSTVRIVP